MEQSSIGERLVSVGNALFAQSAANGALPLLYAATASGVKQNDYFGPRVLEMWGAPTYGSRTAAAKDAEVAKKLWDVSREATGVAYLE